MPLTRNAEVHRFHATTCSYNVERLNRPSAGLIANPRFKCESIRLPGPVHGERLRLSGPRRRIGPMFQRTRSGWLLPGLS